MGYTLTASVHKGTCAEAHLNHNRRTIAVPHADKNRLHLDTAYIDMSVEQAYSILFDKALEEYNKGKKPSRRIKNYYEHIKAQYEKGEQAIQQARSRGASRKELALLKAKRPTLFSEIIVTLGNCDAYNGLFACGGDKEQISIDILNEYMETFKNRNPHLFVFSAHLHLSEQTPHIHIDYIPWTDLEGRGLPVRVSENGAFMQQGLTSGKSGDIGTIAFQEQERCALSEIAKKHNITIAENQHTKKHLSKEEYILTKEKEKTQADRDLINGSAEQVVKLQDELLAYLNENKLEEAFSEHIENIDLRQIVQHYTEQEKDNKKILAQSWQEFNSYTADFFSSYRTSKELLWNEIQQARKTQRYNKKLLADLIYDITDSNDFFIIKIFKLFMALFVAIGNARSENHIEQLQEANRRLKEQARNIMKQSEGVSAILRSKDFENIETYLKQYDIALNKAIEYIHTTAQTVGVQILTENCR